MIHAGGTVIDASIAQPDLFVGNWLESSDVVPDDVGRHLERLRLQWLAEAASSVMDPAATGTASDKPTGEAPVPVTPQRKPRKNSVFMAPSEHLADRAHCELLIDVTRISGNHESALSRIDAAIELLANSRALL